MTFLRLIHGISLLVVVLLCLPGAAAATGITGHFGSFTSQMDLKVNLCDEINCEGEIAIMPLSGALGSPPQFNLVGETLVSVGLSLHRQIEGGSPASNPTDRSVTFSVGNFARLTLRMSAAGQPDFVASDIHCEVTPCNGLTAATVLPGQSENFGFV